MNRKCAVIIVSVVKKRQTSFLFLLLASFGLKFHKDMKEENRQKKARDPKKEAPLSLLHKKNSGDHSLTMADVQHERGYQKQVGVNVG